VLSAAAVALVVDDAVDDVAGFSSLGMTTGATAAAAFSAFRFLQRLGRDLK
jgi:hypothetical protein